MAVHVHHFGEFRLDLATRSLSCAGSEIALPPKALDCIGYLIDHQHRAVGRDELIAAVWGRADISDNALGQAILQARRALRTGANPAHDAIRTVRRFGYHWQMPVAGDRRDQGATAGNVMAAGKPPDDAVDVAAGDGRAALPRHHRAVTGRRTGIAGIRSGFARLAAVAVLALAVQGSRPDARQVSATPPEAGSALEPAAARLRAIDAAIVSGRLDQARHDLSRLAAIDRQRPEVRYRMARVDFMQGRLEEAEAAFDALLDGLPATGSAVLRARIFNDLGNLAYLRENPVAVLAHANAAIQALDGRRAPAEEGRAWVGRASGHTGLQQYDDALADYARARIAFSEAGDPLALARVDAYQGLLEVTRGRPADALPLLIRAADRLQAFDAVIEELHTRVGLVQAYLALLRPGDAMGQDARLGELGARVGDSRRRHYAEFARIRAMTSTGRLDDASALLHSLRSTAATRPDALMERNFRDLPVLATQLAFARDEAAMALPEAVQAIERAGQDDAARAIAQLINWQMRVRLGQLDHAGRIARAADRQDPALEPAARIRLALLEAGQAALEGRSAMARDAFDRALSQAEDYRVPAELLQVAQPYVQYLIAQGDHARASIVAGRVAGWAAVDFTAALVQVELYGALDQSRAWATALAQARALAGERRIPPELVALPAHRMAVNPAR